MKPNDWWVDPRENTKPPYRGLERPLATSRTDLAQLLDACRAGRIYDVELWIKSGRPLQLTSECTNQGRARSQSALAISIDAGFLDLTRLLLCNGFRTELEIESPLNAALETRKWNLVRLLLEWGSDPNAADSWRILDTYQHDMFELFWNAGVDFTRDHALASALKESTRNRPLYGFVKNKREQDARFQHELDIALGSAIAERNDKAASLCLWAGANPRNRARTILSQDDEDEDEWMTALERAVIEDSAIHLKALGFDPGRDDVDPLYDLAWGPNALRVLSTSREPKDWNPIATRTLSHYSTAINWRIGSITIEDVEAVFDLGARITTVDRFMKKELRKLLLSMYGSEAKRLFEIFRNPKNFDPDTLFSLISHEKLAARVLLWQKRTATDRDFLKELSTKRGVPGAIKRAIRERIDPQTRRIPTQTVLNEDGTQRLVTRDELYDLVWSKPLSSLASQFGMTDNGVRNRCKAMRVPTPPRGYWQKRGRGAKKTPLPKLRG